MNTRFTGTIALALAFVLGLLAIAWIGAGFVGTNPIALAMSVAIGAVYLVGAAEIARFRTTTAALASALGGTTQAPESLDAWLARVPPALLPAVRLRVEGERIALPGLALTPYLVGLLVMLGMLGTFLGMVATFRGTVFALEGSGDLQAIRAALAEPIKGLGLAFGTSVAGVAASAMLGLMSAIARGERMGVARHLDAQIATVLRPYSPAHQRQETFKALQLQGTALPEVLRQLQSLIEQTAQRNLQMDERLLERQDRFHRDVSATCTNLAQAVQQSLNSSLDTSARAAGENIRTAVASAMTALVDESRRTQERVGETVQAQLDALAGRFAATATTMTETWAASEQHNRSAWTQALQSTAGEITASASQQASRVQEHIARLLAQSEELVRARVESEARWQQQLAERDTAALQERAALTQNINALLQTVAQASDEQRAAIESLVSSASAVLEQVGRQFSATLDAQTTRAEDAATQVAGSAIELASLGEAFQHGVKLFGASQDKLIESLQRMENALGQSMARSDEQLAYYVAQAREVIDLSISAQQGILEDLRRVQARSVARVEETA